MELQTESIQILHRSEIDKKKGCIMTRDFLENAYLDFGLLRWQYIVNNTPQCARGKKHPGFFPSYISLFLGRSYRNKEGRHFRSLRIHFFKEQILGKLNLFTTGNQYHCKTQIFPLISLNLDRMSWIQNVRQFKNKLMCVRLVWQSLESLALLYVSSSAYSLM